MSLPPYATWNTPESLAKEALKLLEEVRESGGKIRKGANETTKAIERGQAKLVYIALDVSPPDIVFHIPSLCDERDIPYLFVPSKDELGRAAGIERYASAAAIVDPGAKADELNKIIQKIRELRLSKQ